VGCGSGRLSGWRPPPQSDEERGNEPDQETGQHDDGAVWAKGCGGKAGGVEERYHAGLGFESGGQFGGQELGCPVRLGRVVGREAYLKSNGVGRFAPRLT
jgi:hypothetical protein